MAQNQAKANMDHAWVRFALVALLVPCSGVMGGQSVPAGGQGFQREKGIETLGLSWYQPEGRKKWPYLD
jgi:hypothetical protein